ncbi:MAG TPA: tRNA (adenosine(37)-N6)-threonylcarbamoyltransferase complex ATPase subunit type 1 TsaE [Flavobacteriales bacterium]|nr:tRNA (adenosine(37)-N6)-threonylcarbamoyltransferase complex ATPase subunit type 1 TsaE [Flavobacteriales bacterium]
MPNTITYNLNELPKVASTLLQQAGSRKIWLFKGEMGTGKTTLIKEICKQLGVVSNMSSPTFALVNTYETTSGKPVYHFDLYRLKKMEELAGIGFSEYIESGNYCFIEWPEMVEEKMEDVFNLKIEMSGNTRILISGF